MSSKNLSLIVNKKKDIWHINLFSSFFFVHDFVYLRYFDASCSLLSLLPGCGKLFKCCAFLTYQDEDINPLPLSGEDRSSINSLTYAHTTNLSFTRFTVFSLIQLIHLYIHLTHTLTFSIRQHNTIWSSFNSRSSTLLHSSAPSISHVLST